jgi:hypothetical protein
LGKKCEVEARMVESGKNVLFCEDEATCEGKLTGNGNLTKIIIEGKKEQTAVKSKL